MGIFLNWSLGRIGNRGDKHSFHKNSWSPLDVPSPVPGTGRYSRKEQSQAGRARFRSHTPGPTKEGPLACLPAWVSRPPSGRAPVPSQLSFLPLHLQIESNNQNLRGLQNAPCPLGNANQLSMGSVLCFPFPQGLGCPCSISGRSWC